MRHQRLWLVLLFALAVPCFGDQDPNVRRGIAPGNVYRPFDIDVVNEFTGSVIIRIPLADFPVGPFLSEGLQLTYNSAIYDYEFVDERNHPTDPGYKRRAIPETFSNSGLGWTLSLGRLLEPQAGTQSTPRRGWRYRSSTGSEHEFTDSPGDVVEAVTRDGSYLRLRRYPANLQQPIDHWEVESPDGTVSRFTPTGDLTEIRDRVGHKIEIDYSTGGLNWYIRSTYNGQTFRTITVDFEERTSPDPDHPYENNFEKVVSRITVPAFGNVATYELIYKDVILPRDGCGDEVTWDYHDIAVPLLTEIRFPQGLKYEFTYNEELAGGGDCSAGLVKSAKLPTHGTIEWTYAAYALSQAKCDRLHGWVVESPGVYERTVKDGAGNVVGKWTYQSAINVNPGDPIGCSDGNYNFGPAPTEIKTTVTPYQASGTTFTPIGAKNIHYFSGTLNEYRALTTGYKTEEYGLPFTRLTPDSVNPNRFLSAQLEDGGVLRSTYLTYKSDPETIDFKFPNWRVQGELTVFNTDTGCGGACRVDTERPESDYDGYGHYRKSITTSNFGPSRTTFTNYTPRIDSWILGTYDSTWVEEGGVARKQLFTFDDNGVLKSRRTLVGTASSANLISTHPTKDLLEVFCRDTRGFLSSERYFGGDGAAAMIPAGDPCAAAPAATEYQINHTYTFDSYGAPIGHKAQYAGTNFYIADETLDANTALVSSARDAAKIETTFNYDVLGRVTEIRPFGKARTLYQYFNGSETQPASHRATTYGTDANATLLTDAYVFYDWMGRAVQEQRLAPLASGGPSQTSWTVTHKAYDLLSRVTSVWEPSFISGPGFISNDGAGARTTSTYDVLGRPIAVKAPDNSVTKITYSGSSSREKTTTRYVNVEPKPEDEEPQGLGAVTTEITDALGRLISVIEKSGVTNDTQPLGGEVVADYTYDSADRLREVRMKPVNGSPEQRREFVYDGRGYLTSESHPELGNTAAGIPGTVTYQYDARGHVLKKDNPGTGFDLTFSLDKAERVTGVYRPDGKELKIFTFEDEGTSPPAVGRGRLQTAARYNYDANGADPIRVLETYTYDEAGRATTRKTEIARKSSENPDKYEDKLVEPITHSVTFDDLDKPATIEYPKCTFCGTNPLGSRTVHNTYDHGVLSAVDGYVSGLTYHANGLWATRNHSNGVTESQTSDVMPRPKVIEFQNIETCTAIKHNPQDVEVTQGDTAELKVTAAAGSTFEWFEGVSGTTGPSLGNGTLESLNGDTINTLRLPNVGTTKTYWCRVTKDRCEAKSASATVFVCAPAAVIEPPVDADTAQQRPVGTVVQLSVVATGTNMTYEWTKTNTAGGPPVTFATGEPVVAWQVEPGKWNIHVKVTSTCQGQLTTATRLVAIIEGTTCDIVIDKPFDAAFEVPANFPEIYLDFRFKTNTGQTYDSSSFTFKWWLNGILKQSGSQSSFQVPILNSGVLVEAEATGTCGVFHQKTFVFNRDNCPVPAFTVDQTDIGPGATNYRFTVSSSWATVKYTWYKGDTGNTRNQVGTGKSLAVSSADASTYWVRATSSCGTYADSPTLRVRTSSCSPVQFLRQPASATIAAGATHTLSFDATTTPEIASVTWYEGNDIATGIVIGTGRTKMVQPQQTARYFAVAHTASCGDFESAFATVRVTSCGQITVTSEPPASVTYTSGSVIKQTLSIAATSSYALEYQWYEGAAGDTTKPMAAGARSIEIAPADSTSYWVRVSIPGGCAIDRVVSVTVCKPLAITNEPISLQSVSGYRQWLAVETTGTNLSFQWYQRDAGDPTPWQTMTHATARYVQVAPLTTTEYKVVISSACGSPTTKDSQSARVSIPPTAVPQLTGGPVTKGTVRTLSAVSGGTFLQYQWFRGNDDTQPVTARQNVGTFTTPAINSDVTYWARVWSGDAVADTNHATFTVCQPRGITVSQPSLVSGSEVTLRIDVTDANEFYEWYQGDSGNTAVFLGTGTQMKVSPKVTTTYWVRTRRTECDADSAAVTITPCIPRITTEPVSKMINPNETTTLTVAAEGNLPLSYQWYIGPSGSTTNPVPNSNSATLNLGPLTADTTYWAAVSSPAGTCGATTAKSAAATVSVCKVPVINTDPAGTTSTAGAAVVLSVSASATDAVYQWYKGTSGTTTDPVPNGTSSSVTVYPQQTTDYWVRVSGRCGTPVNSATAKISIAPVIGVDPSGAVVTKNDTRHLTVTASGTQLRYQWYRGTDDTNPISGQTSSYYDTPALTATVTYWVRVWSGVLFADSQRATLTVLQPREIVISQPSSVSGSPVTLSLNGTSAAETYQWYRGSTGQSENPIGTGTSIVLSPQQTTSYWVRTKNGTAWADSATATVYVCTPAIQTQPAGTYLMPGASYRLSVAATGTSLSYQWYYGDSGNTSQPISGKTDSYLDVTPPGTTKYWVRVSSSTTGCSTANTYANSSTAIVTVCARPDITADPMSNVVTATQPVTLTVTATGDGLSYQWYEGNSGVTTKPVGTNSSSFTVTAGTTKSYWVRVSGTCGTDDSAAALISVLPSFTTQPADASVCSGTNTRFTVAVSGDPATLTYEWRRLLSGSTTSEAIPNSNATYVDVQATATMQVWCTAKSGNSGWVSSSCATLTPLSPPTIAGTSTTRRAGGMYTLYVNVVEDPYHPITYEWFEGQLGDTRFLIGNSYYVTVTPMSNPAYYWVRVKSDAGCASTAVVTVP